MLAGYSTKFTNLSSFGKPHDPDKCLKIETVKQTNNKMKKNTLILNGQEYDLITLESTVRYFTLYGIVLPLPVHNPENPFQYKAIQIGNDFYGISPKVSIKPIPLDDNILKNMFGWTYEYQEGLAHVYYKSFNGYRWFQLRFVEDTNLLLSVKRIKRGMVEEQILFAGEINDIDQFTYICNLLNIE